MSGHYSDPVRKKLHKKSGARKRIDAPLGDISPLTQAQLRRLKEKLAREELEYRLRLQRQNEIATLELED